MLDYANLAHQLETHDLSLNVTDQDISLSFTILSYFERAWAAYILHRGAILCYLEDTNQVRSALTEIRPTLMCAVPRFTKKIYAAVLDKVQKPQNFAKLCFIGQFPWDKNILIYVRITKLFRSY